MTRLKPDEIIYGELFGFSPSASQNKMIHIIEGAIKCYATIGIEKASYDRIAQSCKISRPLIQHYFRDKDELFMMAIKYIRANFQRVAIEALQSRTNPKDQLAAYVESIFDWYQKFPLHGNVWKLVYYYCDLDPKLREIQTQMVKAGTERIIQLLLLGRSKKIFKFKDGRRAAELIQMVINGALIKISTENIDRDIHEIAKEISLVCLNIAKNEPIS